MASRLNGYGPCKIEDCPYERRRLSEVCANCANFRWRWGAKVKKFGPRAILDRQKQLRFWQHRMLYWGDSDMVTPRFKTAVRKIRRHV